MRTGLLLLCMCAAASALPSDGKFWQRWGHEPDRDPLGAHCFDVSVDTSDSRAMQWLGGNEYLYVNWTKGLCDSKEYPVLESSTHPPGSDKVTLRKSGHNPTDIQEVAFDASASVDCRSDKTTKKMSIAFTNGADVPVKIRGCQNGNVCKPYKDCDLAFQAKASETIVIDASFKYFIFEYKGKLTGMEAELYPDANLKWPAAYTIKEPKMTTIPEMMERMGDMLSTDTHYVISMPTPGHHSHCTELDFKDGKNNPYWQAHGYQYTSPPWSIGHCAKKYNWFNKNSTIAPGVEETLLGIH